jgi:hypothetical protein
MKKQRKTLKNTGPHNVPLSYYNVIFMVKKWGCPDRGWTELEILPCPGAQNFASYKFWGVPLFLMRMMITLW